MFAGWIVFGDETGWLTHQMCCRRADANLAN